MNDLANHLWQSTIFAALVALAALALRRNSARLRYWLWLAASLKFLIPFSLLVSMGSRVTMPPDAPALPALTVVRVSNYFAPAPTFPVGAPVTATSHWSAIFAAIWLAGSLFLLIRWIRRWHKIYSAAGSAKPSPIQSPLPILTTPATMEPGIFGIFRPALLLPEGIADHLTTEQFEAILAHELCHARHRDNLTAALHMCVEAIFWFHPFVWLIGAKLIEERERDCDEAALKQGSRPGDYAQGIVTVCKSYIESPLPCAAGITGADLKKRIREIMTWRGSAPVTLLRKLTLAVAGVAALTIPLAIGIIRAQTLPPAPAYTYGVVSIHPSAPGQNIPRTGPGPQGGLRTQNTTAMQLLQFAYSVAEYQIVGAPGWVSSDRFDVSFTPDKPGSAPATLAGGEIFLHNNAQRMQAVLRDRFGLVLRAETREVPIYALLQIKGGHKLSPTTAGEHGYFSVYAGRITGIGQRTKTLASLLSGEFSCPVVDETGLTGQYDFKLSWTPDSPAPASPDEPAASTTGPSIFTALTEQLGLRLESKKGPVQVYVIEKIEKPSEN